MNKISYTILLLWITLNGNCQGTNNFDVFLNYFPIIELPYNTENLNNENQIISITKGIKIDKDKCLKYFCQGDVGCIQYYYYIYQMEDASIIDKGLKDYNFYPIGKVLFGSYLGLIYFKSGMYSTKFYLNLFLKDGTITDSLLINKIAGETEYNEWQASYIEKDKITTYNYKTNPEYLRKVNFNKDEKSIPHTIITITTYSLNKDVGKFELLNQEIRYSHCSVDEFVSKAEDCKCDDPMNLLPK